MFDTIQQKLNNFTKWFKCITVVKVTAANMTVAVINVNQTRKDKDKITVITALELITFVGLNKD